MVAVWIACAYALGIAVQRLGLPPLVGFLAAGFALHGLGYEAGPVLEEIAHLGVLILLFSVGLKVRLKNVLRAEVWATALAHLVVTGALLGAAVHLLAGVPWTTAFMIATALGFSSTVLAAKILEVKRELRAFHGRIAVGILIVQDLVAVGLLAVAGAGAPSPWALSLLALPLLRPVLAWLLVQSGHGEMLVIFGMLLAIVAGGAGFEALGMSGELGALVFGALLADHERAGELFGALWSLKEVFLVGFFLAIGMSGLPDVEALGLAGALVLALPVKAALFFFLLVAFRLRARTAFLTGLSLASYSEFGLIFAQVAVTNGVLGDDWLVLLAITVALSFAVSAPLHEAAHTLYERNARALGRFESGRKHPDDAPISVGSAEIVILGMGRVGTGAYDFLRARDARVVGLDSDPAKVQRHIREGRRVGYADAEDPAFWQRINLVGVRAVLLALPDLEAKLDAVTQLRRNGYTGLVSATNVYPEEAEAIMRRGCTTCFNYFTEAGVGFGQHAWEALRGRERSPA